ncbi:hypothetical protein SAMN04490181_2412 [Pseudomonas brenneri]|uniref:Uncharacterized protein n=1 Tax=Pseudomonas brenneri TaxID=129817 RepID=A0ABY0WCY2_9PSED|nr:hypothetical protein SAMN04490181_2412 [Pseudomonas brenneri]
MAARDIGPQQRYPTVNCHVSFPPLLDPYSDRPPPSLQEWLPTSAKYVAYRPQWFRGSRSFSMTACKQRAGPGRRFSQVLGTTTFPTCPPQQGFYSADQPRCDTCASLHCGAWSNGGSVGQHALGKVVRCRGLECVLTRKILELLNFGTFLARRILTLDADRLALRAVFARRHKKGLRQAGSLSSKRR